MADMRAYLASPDTRRPTLQTRPVPRPGDDEVLVQVQAVTLNNGDLAPVGEPQVPGFEFVGEVVEIGAEADPRLLGQVVMGIGAGAFAEFALAHHTHVLPVPAGLDPVAAATLPTALSTGYGAVRRSGMVSGDSVLVTGTQDLAETTRSLTGGAGADVVLDHVGGAALDAAIAAARLDGSVVSVGRLAGGRAEVDLFALARRRVHLQSVSYGLTPPEIIGDLMAGVRTDLLPALAAGRITPVVDSTHAFDRLGQALDRLASGQAQGKVAATLR